MDWKDERDCLIIPEIQDRLKKPPHTLDQKGKSALEVILGRMDGRRLAALSHWSLTKV